MARVNKNSYGRERVTLRQTLVVAVLLHLMLAGVAEYRPELLWSQPLGPEPLPEQRPIEFRFVDTPDREPPVEVPDTEVYSDRDREARDASERDSAADPASQGNTSQQVLRGAAAPPVQPQPTAPTPPVDTPPLETAAEQPQPRPETPPESSERSRLEAPPLATPPVTLPPRQPNLRDSLSRLESYIQPEAYDNPEGGADGPQGLVDFDTKGYELGPYLRQVLAIIERNWKGNIPPAARLPGMNGATFVALSIERFNGDRGEQARIVVHRVWSSGKPSFDQAAQLALEVSSPLPPIPAFFPYERLDGRIGFLYNLEPSQVTFPPRQ